MTVYHDKARNRWRYDFRHRGRRHTGYCDDPATGTPAANRTEARRVETILKGEVRRRGAARAAAPAPDAYTLGQAMAAYSARRAGSRNWANCADYVRELLAWFGADRPLCEITEEMIWRYVNEHARKAPRRVWIGGPSRAAAGPRRRQWKTLDGTRRSDSTINRYLDALRAALRDAHRTIDPVSRQPLLPVMPRVPHLDEPKDLPNPVPMPAIAAMLRTAPPHLQKALLLTVGFGFRKMEALTLTRDAIDWDNRGIRLDSSTKGKRGEFLPADEALMGWLAQLDAEAAAAGVDALVFYTPPKGRPRPVTTIKRSWATALRKAGLEGRYRWHDTKATFVTMIAHLAPGAVVQDWARHKSPSTTQRYLKVADEAKREAASGLADRLAGAGLPFLRLAADNPKAPRRPTRKSHTAGLSKTAKRRK